MAKKVGLNGWLQRVRETGEHSDVVVRVTGEEFRLHMLPLRNESGYFRDLPSSSNGIEQVDEKTGCKLVNIHHLPGMSFTLQSDDQALNFVFNMHPIVFLHDFRTIVHNGILSNMLLICVARWSRRFRHSCQYVLSYKTQFHGEERGPRVRGSRVSSNGRRDRKREKIHALKHLLALAVLCELLAELHPHWISRRRIRGISLPKGARHRMCEVLHRD